MTDTAPTAPARPYVPAGLRILHAAIRDAGPTAPGATVTVTLTVPEDPHAALLITGATVAPRPELVMPAPPHACDRCQTSYRACSEAIRRGERCCCGSCYSVSTHGQNAWEEFHRRVNRSSYGLAFLPADPS